MSWKTPPRPPFLSPKVDLISMLITSCSLIWLTCVIWPPLSTRRKESQTETFPRSVIAFSTLLHRYSPVSPPTHSGFNSILLLAAAEALLGGELHRHLRHSCHERACSIGEPPPRTTSPPLLTRCSKDQLTLAWLFTGRCAEGNLSCSLTQTLSAASPRGGAGVGGEERGRERVGGAP